MKIGIIAAMRHEMDLLAEQLDDLFVEDYASFKFYCGSLGNNDVIIVESGMGKANAVMASTLLVSRFECNLLINTGIAGGISPLETNDVILGTKIMYGDVDARLFGVSYGQIPGMPKYYSPSDTILMLAKRTLNKLNISYKQEKIYTSDKFITTFEPLKEIEEKDGAAIEMEGCAVAQTATRLGVDFLVIRYICDIIGKENQEKDYFKFEHDVAERSALITSELIKNIFFE